MKVWARKFVVNAADLIALLLLHGLLIRVMADKDIASRILAAGRHVPRLTLAGAGLFAVVRVLTVFCLPGMILNRIGMLLMDYGLKRGAGCHPAVLLLRSRPAFWERVRENKNIGALILHLLLFIVASSAIYGAVLAGWRSPRLAAYVAVKLPILMVGITSLVMLLNWLLATVMGSGLSLRQVVGITYGAMGTACWILLSLAPVTLFFTLTAASGEGSHRELQLTHNYLLLTHIALIAMAGVAGNNALRQGLRETVASGCPASRLYWSWIVSFAFVGCQLSWILRPFVGSPFYPVVFLRPDCLDRNFYEFVFCEVLPYVLRGG